jgi:hypothetical protein
VIARTAADNQSRFATAWPRREREIQQENEAICRRDEFLEGGREDEESTSRAALSGPTDTCHPSGLAYLCPDRPSGLGLASALARCAAMAWAASALEGSKGFTPVGSTTGAGLLMDGRRPPTTRALPEGPGTGGSPVSIEVPMASPEAAGATAPPLISG